MSNAIAAPATGAVGNRAVNTAFIAEEILGKAKSVKQRFDTMEERFIPSKAKGVNLRAQFILTGKGGGNWYVEIKDGKITVKEGKGKDPMVTVTSDAKLYLDIANGDANKMWAFLRGKLQVDGDKDLLEDFDSYFKPL